MISGGFELLKKLFDNSDKLVIVRHKLAKHETIEPHSHEANEAVVCYEGEFEVTADNETEAFMAPAVVYFPSGSTHGLRALSDDLEYYVLRDR